MQEVDWLVPAALALTCPLGRLGLSGESFFALFITRTARTMRGIFYAYDMHCEGGTSGLVVRRPSGRPKTADRPLKEREAEGEKVKDESESTRIAENSTQLGVRSLTHFEFQKNTCSHNTYPMTHMRLLTDTRRPLHLFSRPPVSVIELSRSTLALAILAYSRASFHST